MSNVLAEICAAKLEHVAERKANHPFAAMMAAAREVAPPRGFRASLSKAVADGRYGLVAEIKKASPSKGLIRADFEPADLARAYQAGGATCLSVLTDGPYFMGHDADLVEAWMSVSLPVLRKDFMLDPYQIVESRALGADCVLLIMAAIDDAQARELQATADEFSLDVLAEVHNARELDRALSLNAGLIGINNRDLRTFEVDLSVTETLAVKVPADRIVISESGLNRPSDLARLAKTGVKCFLVGELLMRQDDVEAATRRLLSAPGEEG
jgi:indole-3-glycerol phosphate synthase